MKRNNDIHRVVEISSISSGDDDNSKRASYFFARKFIHFGFSSVVLRIQMRIEFVISWFSSRVSIYAVHTSMGYSNGCIYISSTIWRKNILSLLRNSIQNGTRGHYHLTGVLRFSLQFFDNFDLLVIMVRSQPFCLASCSNT